MPKCMTKIYKHKDKLRTMVNTKDILKDKAEDNGKHKDILYKAKD
jgi:hypothetical protein